MIDRTVSIVAPAFDEEGNIGAFATRVRACMAAQPVAYELILVDDGSRDSTWSKIQEVAMSDPHVRGLRLVRNFGQQSALLAGLMKSAGAAVVTMDVDLQHPPELLPKMVAAWRDGAPVILTRRRHESGGGWFKRNASAAFYRLFSAITGVPTRPGSSDFRLLDRGVLRELLAFRGSHGFLRGAIDWLGYPSVTIDYDVGTRASGETKYSLRKMLQFAATAIVTFTTRPLHIAFWIGTMLAAFAFAELAFVLVQYVRGVTIPGWASLVGIVSLLLGFQFLLLGIIGLYIARIHVALQAPPTYVVAEETGSACTPSAAPRLDRAHESISIVPAAEPNHEPVGT